MKCENNEVLFVVVDDTPLGDESMCADIGLPFIVFVTPENYWQAQHCLYDQFIENTFLTLNFPELSECTLEATDTSLTVASATALLLKNGFKQDAAFSKFMGGSGSSATPPTSSGPKLDSDTIKQQIVTYIVNNSGCIKALFDPQDRTSIDEIEVQNVKVWKRDYKGHGSEGIERIFYARGSKQDEVAEQVKAIVVTDFTDTVIKSITFEG